MNSHTYDLPEFADIKRQSLFVGLFLFFIFINLNLYTNKLPLFGEEHRRSIVAQEMMLTGDFISPTIFQQPYMNKPPMQNWLIVLASLPFGEVTSFSARFISIASFMLIAISMYLFMLKIKREIALIAFLAVSTNYLMLCEYGNMAEPDMLVTMFTFLSYIFYILNPQRFANILISSFFMGAGILAKGVSPIFSYPAIILYLLRIKENRGRLFSYLGLHAGLSLVLPVAWLLIYYSQGDALHLVRNFSHEVATRTDRTFRQFFLHLLYFPARAFIVLLPWSLATWYAFKRNINKDPVYITSLMIFIISIAIFAIIPGSRDRYLLPAYPFFAIIAAYHINSLKMPSKRFQQIIFAMLAAAGLGTAFYFIVLEYYIQVIILIMLAAICLWLMKKQFRIMEFATIFVLAFFMLFEHGLYYYRTHDRFDYFPETVELNRHIQKPLPIVVDPRMNIRTGLYLEKLRREPVYRKGLKNFGSYYYVTYPDGVDTTAMKIIRIPRADKPERSLVLQYYDTEE